MEYLGSLGIQAVKNAFSWIFQRNTQEENRANEPNLHPLTTLVQIALLSFKEKYTRLRIDRNEIVTQQRSDYDYIVNVQSCVRTYQYIFESGANREDLKVLKKCIKKAAQWYRPNENEVVRKLFQYAKQGLASLRKTYKDKSKITCDAISKWITLIDTLCEEEGEDSEPLSNLAMRVKDLYSINDIKAINKLIKIAKQQQGETDPSEEIKCKYKVQAIEIILAGKTQAFKELLREGATL